jgi:hypothetical protein
MCRDDQFLAGIQGEQVPAKLLNGYGFSDQAAGSEGAQGNNQFGLHQAPFDVAPPLATLNLVTVWPFV